MHSLNSSTQLDDFFSTHIHTHTLTQTSTARTEQFTPTLGDGPWYPALPFPLRTLASPGTAEWLFGSFILKQINLITTCKTTKVTVWISTSPENGEFVTRHLVHQLTHTHTHSPSITKSLLLFYSSASNRIIYAKDHASIQISLAQVDEKTGRINGHVKHYAICGALRRMVMYFISFYTLWQC